MEWWPSAPCSWRSRWLGLFFWWRGTLADQRALLWVFVFAVLGPQAANQLGWITAEVGRQPWIVYKVLRTSAALSKTVQAGTILASLVMFTLIYACCSPSSFSSSITRSAGPGRRGPHARRGAGGLGDLLKGPRA
jgi:cytochrome bd-type quinol oxidase subunit 1